MQALIVIALVLCAACAQPQPTPGSTGTDPGTEAPAVAKRMVAAVMGTPPSLSSRISVGVANVPGVDVLEEMVHSGMVTVDDRGELVPRLAEAVPSVENGLWKVFPDGRMETTWRIRPNAAWHDGRPLAAQDLAFTLRVGRDRDLPNFADVAYQSIEQVDTPDPRTLIVTWSQPFIGADRIFSPKTGMPLPAHLIESAYTDDKASFTQLAYWSDEFVGAGSFRVREWATGSHVTFEANTAYALGRPKLDEVLVRFIPDQNALIANLLAGAVHVTIGRNLSLDQALQVRDQWPDGKVDVGSRGLSVIWPQFLNPSPSTVANVPFRRAMLHAIDRQALVDSLMGGMVFVAHAMLSPNDPELKEVERSVLRYDHDPARAAQMIEGLGYTRGSDRLFRDPSGQPLSVELRTVAVDLHQKTTFAVADDWQRIGVTVEPVVIPPARQGDLEYRALFPAFQIFGAQSEIAYLPRLHSSRTPLPESRWVGTNYSRYRSAEWDALLERLMATIPRAERLQVLSQVLHHMSDQLNLMPLFFREDTILVNKRVLNVSALSAEGATHAWNAHEWDAR
jgi:peptide/nickel transport system substrate-binding protein